MMKRLDLDWCARAATPWLGRVVLVAAAAVMVDAGMSYHTARKTVQVNETRIAKRAPTGPAAKVSSPELAVVRETVQRLALPWDELFAALESAANDKVVLTSIEPDSGKGTVTISGDGKDYLAALSYVANLRRSDSIERAELVRHERKHADPNGPVSFTVSAAWIAR